MRPSLASFTSVLFDLAEADFVSQDSGLIIQKKILFIFDLDYHCLSWLEKRDQVKDGKRVK
ncbi:hypothetical protein [Candidatus Nitrosocosmicus sp. T]